MTTVVVWRKTVVYSILLYLCTCEEECILKAALITDPGLYLLMCENSFLTSYAHFLFFYFIGSTCRTISLLSLPLLLNSCLSYSASPTYTHYPCFFPPLDTNLSWYLYLSFCTSSVSAQSSPQFLLHDSPPCLPPHHSFIHSPSSSFSISLPLHLSSVSLTVFFFITSYTALPSFCSFILPLPLSPLFSLAFRLLMRRLRYANLTLIPLISVFLSNLKAKLSNLCKVEKLHMHAHTQSHTLTRVLPTSKLCLKQGIKKKCRGGRLL